MLYATDINIYVAQLANCVATAVDLMKNHGAGHGYAAKVAKAERRSARRAKK